MTKLRFRGRTEELKDLVETCRRRGCWRWNPVSKQWRFTGEQDEILIWWVNSGTVQFQGQDQKEFRAQFEKRLRDQRGRSEPEQARQFNSSLQLSAREQRLIETSKQQLAEKLKISATLIKISILAEY